MNVWYRGDGKSHLLACSVEEKDEGQIVCISQCAAFAFASACDDDEEGAKERS
jgi:hypothetical protein